MYLRLVSSIAINDAVKLVNASSSIDAPPRLSVTSFFKSGNTAAKDLTPMFLNKLLPRYKCWISVCLVSEFDIASMPSSQIEFEPR